MSLTRNVHAFVYIFTGFRKYSIEALVPNVLLLFINVPGTKSPFGFHTKPELKTIPFLEHRYSLPFMLDEIPIFSFHFHYYFASLVLKKQSMLLKRLQPTWKTSSCSKYRRR